jgi:hypothetical protein
MGVRIGRDTDRLGLASAVPNQLRHAGCTTDVRQDVVEEE